MSIVLNEQQFLEHAKYYLLREGIVDENGKIDQERLEKELNKFNENIVKYTLDIEEFFLLEKYVFVNRHSFDVNDDLYKNINDVMSTDYSRAQQGVDKEMKFHYYFLVGVLWEKIRDIIDMMRASDFKTKMRCD